MKQNPTSPGIARFTKILLDVLFYAGIAVTVSVPWTMRWAAGFYPSFSERLTLHTALFLLAGGISEVHERFSAMQQNA